MITPELKDQILEFVTDSKNVGIVSDPDIWAKDLNVNVDFIELILKQFVNQGLIETMGMARRLKVINQLPMLMI